MKLADSFTRLSPEISIIGDYHEKYPLFDSQGNFIDDEVEWHTRTLISIVLNRLHDSLIDAVKNKDFDDGFDVFFKMHFSTIKEGLDKEISCQVERYENVKPS